MRICKLIGVVYFAFFRRNKQRGRPWFMAVVRRGETRVVEGVGGPVEVGGDG